MYLPLNFIYMFLIFYDLFMAWLTGSSMISNSISAFYQIDFTRGKVQWIKKIIFVYIISNKKRKGGQHELPDSARYSAPSLSYFIVRVQGSGNLGPEAPHLHEWMQKNTAKIAFSGRSAPIQIEHPLIAWNWKNFTATSHCISASFQGTISEKILSCEKRNVTKKISWRIAVFCVDQLESEACLRWVKSKV